MAGTQGDPLDEIYQVRLGFPRIRIAAVGRLIPSSGVRHGGFTTALQVRFFQYGEHEPISRLWFYWPPRVGCHSFGMNGGGAAHDPLCGP